ncbi:unnamed protein product, partial [Hapterophycus canaliculatus]
TEQETTDEEETESETPIESETPSESAPPVVAENSDESEDVQTDTTNGQPGEVADIVDLEDAHLLVFNNDLPMGGLFYGHPGNGWKTGNAKIAVQSARRFMAERSGNIVAVR